MAYDNQDYGISFMEIPDPLVRFLAVSHARNSNEYLSLTYSLLPGLMAYDNHVYGRWFPEYWAMISTLLSEKMTFISNHFVQSMTGLHHTCGPLDLCIETTMKWHQWHRYGDDLASGRPHTWSLWGMEAGLFRLQNGSVYRCIDHLKNLWLHPLMICWHKSHHLCQWLIQPPVQYKGWWQWLKGSKMMPYLKY